MVEESDENRPVRMNRPDRGPFRNLSFPEHRSCGVRGQDDVRAHREEDELNNWRTRRTSGLVNGPVLGELGIHT